MNVFNRFAGVAVACSLLWFAGCGNDSGNDANSSEIANSSSSVSSSSLISSSSENMSSAQNDTTTITYALKPFDGPLSNPHKGFTVVVGGTWTFVPEFEYGPYGSLNNRAWDLVSYGSGYHQWNKLNPQNGVYDWTELDKLLDACEKNGLGYALRVLPYTPSFIKSNDTPTEEYDWTPPFVYEMDAKKNYSHLGGERVPRASSRLG